MREKTLEHKFVMTVKRFGGLAVKFTSPGFDGMPDRLVLFPKGYIGFVEVKASGKKPRPIQVSRIKLLKRLGFKAYILDDEEKIGGIINDITGGDA